ncbi:MAG: sn-glycerol-3-phosphate ABC transporter ATP-binding protein UgpC [Anaerococcus prevotii]|nr:sn-glycerol-3-phosphate ABC transporter ATP-binding protein UgpC [uncultured Anaerococcus sp.]MDU3136955.1 sn-glycerol-3-phosphate ABC transporter ATP-binding protein UgpC [Anaerococcus prevotii]
MIRLEHVYKDYNPGEHVVRDFNLEIEEGEFIVIVGPSGCGKSTTLRMIAGLEDITSGKLYFDDKLMNDIHPKDRDIAMVFQNYALYPHMSVAENMGFGLKMKKIEQKTIDETVAKTSKMIGLESYLDRLPKELSGGQRQRVALGRAISRNPKVFLMDEPLSNLDAKLRVQTRSEISNLSKQFNNTTIYVTHDQVEAMTMADRIVLMKDGVIQQVSTPREIYLHPNNQFVAGFMGSPAMNFIDVKVLENSLATKNQSFELRNDILNDLSEKGYKDKDIILGIRPENIHLQKDIDITDDRYSLFSVNLTLAEMLGSETLLHFLINDASVIAKINTFEKFDRDQKVALAIDIDFIHFFDKESGDRIDIKCHGEYKKVIEEGSDLNASRKDRRGEILTKEKAIYK